MNLKKELKLLEVFSITSGAMLSSGIFLLPGLAFVKAGPSLFLAYILAGLLAMTGMLSQAELSTAMPKSGGTYYYVTRSMGTAVGTVYGLITMMALILKSAFELMAMATFFRLVYELAFSGTFGGIYIRIIAACICGLIILINLTGTKGAGRVQVVFVFIIISALAVYVIAGLPHINIHHFQPFTTQGAYGIFSTAGYVFVSYGGLLKIASIAEEIKNPGKVLPLGMILSLIIVVFIYTLVIFVTVGILNPSDLSNSLSPISDGANIILGPAGTIILSIVAILAFSSAANASIMGASRYPLALSRDNLLPAFFGRINSRFHSPHVSLIMSGITIVAVVFLDLDIIIKSASAVLILTYIFSCLANLIMRESRLQNYQPKFKAPLYPWIQIVGIIGCGFLLFEIGKQAIVSSLLLLLIGVIIYIIYGRAGEKRKYALMHLIERITAKELTDHSLETELKEVLRERDDIIKDRFDHLIEECTVLDLQGSVSMDDLFLTASEKMAGNLKTKPKQLNKALLEREKESSTALSPTFAVPHIIIKGGHVFDILLARSKEGIYFSETSPNVHAIFILAGTRDERNFHLRALSAIAQILQDPKFEEKWLKAKNIESLRDIVLLGERRR